MGAASRPVLGAYNRGGVSTRFVQDLWKCGSCARSKNAGLARMGAAMLVLSRQKNQSICIGQDVTITVVDIRGDKVRLGVAAPRTLPVHREEIYQLIRDENQQASRLRPEDLGHGAALATPAVTIGPGIAANGAAVDPFLQAAIDEARLGLSEGGLPIGSVLVRDGQIIGRGHNRRVQKGDPMAHAEIECLRHAGRQNSYRDAILYSTLMPCFLCSGAVLQFGIRKVVVGESINFPGGAAAISKSPDLLRANGIELTDVSDPQCIQMMADFIRAKPQLWNEDIGR